MSNEYDQKSDKQYHEKFIPTKENLTKVKKAFEESRKKSIKKKGNPDAFVEIK